MRSRLLRRGALTAPVLAVQALLGTMVASGTGTAAAGAFGVVALVAALLAPALVATAALPASYAYWRFGPASLSLSLTDVCLVLALLAALPHVPWRSPVLRALLRVVLVYLAILLVAVAAQPSRRAVLEFAHRAFLAGGCLVVGSTIAAMGRTRFALRTFIVVSAGVATAAIMDTLQRGLAPAYPLGMHKNAVGALLVGALLVVVVGPRLLQLSRPALNAITAVLLAGMLACQSRGAVLTLVALLLLVPVVRHARSGATRSGTVQTLLLVLGLCAATAMTVMTVSALFTADAADDRFNSLNSRVLTYEAALDLWLEKPLTGQGLKFWRDPALAGRTQFGEPHNLVVSALGESGIVGLAGLVVLVGGSIVILRRSRTDVGHLALFGLVALAVNSLLGIYWVAGTFSLPWLIAGLASGSAPAPADERVTPEAARL